MHPVNEVHVLDEGENMPWLCKDDGPCINEETWELTGSTAVWLVLPQPLFLPLLFLVHLFLLQFSIWKVKNIHRCFPPNLLNHGQQEVTPPVARTGLHMGGHCREQSYILWPAAHPDSAESTPFMLASSVWVGKGFVPLQFHTIMERTTELLLLKHTTSCSCSLCDLDIKRRWGMKDFLQFSLCVIYAN